MSEHTVTLPESIYRRLIAVAQLHGMTPEEWIASKLATPAELPEPSSEFPKDLIGSIDSSSEEAQAYRRAQAAKKHKKPDYFGESFIADMARQGIHIPQP